MSDPKTELHPQQLYALTALHDLAAAIPALRQQAVASEIEAAVGLRSTIYGTRHSTGSHSDGVLPMLFAADHGSARWQNLLDQVRDDLNQACWLVRSALPALARDTPIRYLATGIRQLPPATARDLNSWLTAAARRAWRALGLPPPREPLVGVPCPRCHTRLLRVATAAPDRADWTVSCQTCRHITAWTATLATPARENAA